MERNENVALRLSRQARLTPDALAICEPNGPIRSGGRRSYEAVTFSELNNQTDEIARGLLNWGCTPGMRLVLAVPFGTEFIRLTFGLLKAGLVPVLVDPGMGRKHLIRCLEESKPDGFVAIPRAQAIRWFLQKRFPQAKWNLTVGRRMFWGGITLSQLMQRGQSSFDLPSVTNDDDAAIIFTTGSTGPPKGVRYTHKIFNNQIELIRTRYQIRSGSRDLACFPLFGLFDSMMGVTTIIPEMDPTRPADVNPLRLKEAIEQWEIEQAFGSPALWKTVTAWCQQTGEKLTNLRLVLSAGAPVSPRVLESLRSVIHPDANVFTPYGATEALPLASIESREVLDETAALSRQGLGTCVGNRFDLIEWRVIQITDTPIERIEQTVEVPRGQIGELMVTGPVVTKEYVTRVDQNALHKVLDGDRVWHRMGDVGYLDDCERFWFCGRKSQRVITDHGTLHTDPCEAIFNNHAGVSRCALVGIGRHNHKKPVIVIELTDDQQKRGEVAIQQLVAELRTLATENPLTRQIQDVLVYPKRLPVDIRHNSKIFREQLAEWAETKLRPRDQGS